MTAYDALRIESDSNNSTDSQYIALKLRDIAKVQLNTLSQETSQTINNFIRRGHNHSGAFLRGVREAIEKNYRNLLDAMSRFLIDVGANKNKTALDLFSDIANETIETIIKDNGRHITEESLNFSEKEFSAHLSNIAALARQDLMYGIVGAVKYGNNMGTNINASSSNIIMNSTNANIAYNHGVINQNLYGNSDALLATLEEVTKHLSTKKEEDVKAIKAQVQILEQELKSNVKDITSIEMLGNLIVRFLHKLNDAVTSELANRIMALLP